MQNMNNAMRAGQVALIREILRIRVYTNSA